nr:hypothetical protein [Moritella viscosa]SHO03622.1 Phage tail tape measure protein, TP901 family [Moritella viscosa]
MALNMQGDDLTPDERKQIAEVERQHKESIQATKKLTNMIKDLSATNKRDGNKTGTDTYTKNLMDVKTVTSSFTKDLTSTTAGLFDQLATINDDARTQNEQEQRGNLKQLKVLSKLSDEIQNLDHREAFKQMVNQTESTFRKNTSALGSMGSMLMSNAGLITGTLSSLNDSPLLGAIGGGLFDSIAGKLGSDKRDNEKQYQSGLEASLSEQMAQQNDLIDQESKLVDAIEKRILADGKTDGNDSTSPQQVESKIPSGSDLDSVSTGGLIESLDSLTIELIDLNAAINNKLSSFSGDTSPLQVSTNSDAMLDTNQQAVDQLKIMNDALSPMVNGIAERRQESERFNDKMLAALQELSPEQSGLSGDNKDSGGGMSGLFVGMGAKVTQYGATLLASLGASFKGMFGKLGGMVTRLFTGGGFLKTMLRGLSKLALPLTLAMALGNGILEGFKTFSEGGSFGDTISSFLAGMWDSITFGIFGQDNIEKITNVLVDGMLDFYGAIGAWFSDGFNTIIEGTVNIYEDLKKSITDSLGALIDSITAGITDMFTIDMFKGKSIGESLGVDGFMNDASKTMKGWFTDTPDKQQSVKTNRIESVPSSQTVSSQTILSTHVPAPKQDAALLAIQKELLAEQKKGNLLAEQAANNAGTNNIMTSSNTNVSNNQTVIAQRVNVHNQNPLTANINNRNRY